MINSSQWNDLYTAYGRAILTTHMLEQRVVMLVTLWRFLKSDRSDGTFITNHYKLLKTPFGKVLELGIREGAVSKENAEALENYRKLRNHLVHDITSSITLRLCTNNEPLEVIYELNELANLFERVSQELMKDVFNMYEFAGGSMHSVINRAYKLIEEASRHENLKSFVNKATSGASQGVHKNRN